jgi:hypothetical protein
MTRVSTSAALIILAASFGFLASADDEHDRKVKAFQTALNYMQDNKGCLSIPYSDLQDSCVRKQAEVNKMCKDSGPWNCDDVDPKETQKKIESVKTERDDLKRQRESLERITPVNDDAKRQKDEAIKKIDDRLYEIKRTQENLEREVSESTKKVNDRMYVGKACRDNRQNVMEVFRDAKSRANGEHDADIEPIAKKLIAGWEKEEDGHDKAVQAAKVGVERCDKVLYEIGHTGF